MGCQAIVGCAGHAAQQARACYHGSYEIDSTATPSSHVSPYNGQLVEGLHEDILFRMRVLGYDLDRQEKGSFSASVFHTKKLGIVARSRYDRETGRFTVLAGSTVALDGPTLKNAGAMEMRTPFRRLHQASNPRGRPDFLKPKRSSDVRARRQPERQGRMDKRRRQALHEAYRTTE